MKRFDNVNAKQDCWRQKEIVMKTYLSAWAIYYIQNVDDTTFIWNDITFSFFPLFSSVLNIELENTPFCFQNIDCCNVFSIEGNFVALIV